MIIVAVDSFEVNFEDFDQELIKIVLDVVFKGNIVKVKVNDKIIQKYKNHLHRLTSVAFIIVSLKHNLKKNLKQNLLKHQLIRYIYINMYHK